MSFPELPIIFILKSHQTIFHARLSQEKQNKMGPSERDLLSSLLYGFFIIVEIADRVVDGFILTKYEVGEISNDWNKNVKIALTVFMVIWIFHHFTTCSNIWLQNHYTMLRGRLQ